MKADKIIATPDEQVLSACITPDGKFVITVTCEPNKPIAETKVKVWDTKTGDLKTTLMEGGNVFYKVTLSPNGNLLLVGHDRPEKEAELYDVSDLTKKPRLLKTFDKSSSVSSVAFSPDEKTLLLGNRDGSVQVYSAKSGNLVWRKAAHRGPHTNRGVLTGRQTGRISRDRHGDSGP